MDNQLTFGGSSLATIHNQDQHIYQSLAKQNKAPNTAAQDDRSMQEERFYQKEDINSQDSCRISFEEMFMTQHAAVLTQEIKNFIESAHNYILQYNQQAIERTYQPNQQASYQDLVSSFDGFITFQFKNRLLNELKSNDRLFQMLNIVAKACPLKISIELITISLQILDQYRKNVANSDESLELFTLMEIAFEKSKNMQRFQALNLVFKAQLQRQENAFMLIYQKFMEVYCVTTILVLAEYFQNPYYQKQQLGQLPKRLLRQLDDDCEMEEEVDTRPQKKRKSSK